MLTAQEKEIFQLAAHYTEQPGGHRYSCVALQAAIYTLTGIINCYDQYPLIERYMRFWTPEAENLEKKEAFELFLSRCRAAEEESPGFRATLLALSAEVL